MDADDSLEKLRKAVANRSEDVALRLELVDVLLDAGHPQSAWHHCIRILDKNPRHVTALRVAERAATAAGAADRAREYAERLAALPDAALSDAAPMKRYEINGLSWRLIRGGRENGETRSTVTRSTVARS